MNATATPESGTAKAGNMRILVDAVGDCVDVFEPRVAVVSWRLAAARVASGDEIVTTLVPPRTACADDMADDARVAYRKAAADFDAACTISLADADSEHMPPAWPQASAVDVLLGRGYALEHEGRAVSDAAARSYAGGRYPSLS